MGDEKEEGAAGFGKKKRRIKEARVRAVTGSTRKQRRWD